MNSEPFVTAGFPDNQHDLGWRHLKRFGEKLTGTLIRLACYRWCTDAQAEVFISQPDPFIPSCARLNAYSQD
jgi:hypothetical protein